MTDRKPSTRRTALDRHLDKLVRERFAELTTRGLALPMPQRALFWRIAKQVLDALADPEVAAYGERSTLPPAPTRPPARATTG